MTITANDRRYYPRTYAALDRVRDACDQIRVALRHDDPQIAVDIDECRNGHPSRFPQAGDELLLSEIPCSTYIRLAGEDVVFLGHRGDILDGLDLNGTPFAYHAAEDERFPFVGDLV